MGTRKLTSDDAFQLSKAFRDASVTLGDYRFANWTQLKPRQRKAIEDAEWSLLNASADMTTVAVGLVLDESQTSLQDLRKATAKASYAIKRLKTVGQVIEVATAAVGLAAAVIARDPAVIAKKAEGLYHVATGKT